MVETRAHLLDEKNASLFEASVSIAGSDVLHVLDAAASALGIAAQAVSDGTIADLREVRRVAFIQVGDRAPISLDEVVTHMLHNGRAHEAAAVTTLLADGVELHAARRRREFRLVPR